MIGRPFGIEKMKMQSQEFSLAVSCVWSLLFYISLHQVELCHAVSIFGFHLLFTSTYSRLPVN